MCGMPGETVKLTPLAGVRAESARRIFNRCCPSCDEGSESDGCATDEEGGVVVCLYELLVTAAAGEWGSALEL